MFHYSAQAPRASFCNFIHNEQHIISLLNLKVFLGTTQGNRFSFCVKAVPDAQ